MVSIGQTLMSANASSDERSKVKPGLEGEPRGPAPDVDSPVLYHVDARVMSMIVDSLVEELELLDSYTLVILNPRKNLLAGRYGYREGFSAAEMTQLRWGPAPPRPAPNAAHIGRAASNYRMEGWQMC